MDGPTHATSAPATSSVRTSPFAWQSGASPARRMRFQRSWTITTRLRSALCLLQLLPDTQIVASDASNGSGLDSIGTTGVSWRLSANILQLHDLAVTQALPEQPRRFLCLVHLKSKGLILWRCICAHYVTADDRSTGHAAFKRHRWEEFQPPPIRIFPATRL